MAITREKKKETVDRLQNLLGSAKSVVFVNFKGLGVADTNGMRNSLRTEGVGYTVAKKSLMRLALKDGNTTGEIPPLEGEIAIAWSEDEMAAAQRLWDFQKQFKDKLSIVGGIFDGRFLGQGEMLEVAQTPSMQVLRGMFVNIINSPIQRTAIALGQIAAKKA